MHPTGDKSTDDIHRDRTADGSEEQELTTAPFVDKDCQPEDRNDGLNHTKKTSQEIDGVLARYAHCEAELVHCSNEKG